MKNFKTFAIIFFLCSICPCTITSALNLQNDSSNILLASTDYGNLVHLVPSSVLQPSSISDIIDIIKLSNKQSTPFTIAARGHGHSVRGQAMTRGGVVVNMTSLDQIGNRIIILGNDSFGYYADVGGEQLWIDVLHAALEYGLAPVAWTDYLYLSVGGTLSNAGISGQAFLHGPQINNVLQLDVITGKGDLITCSRTINSQLFFAVLGGLGQFGIITRARVILDKAPPRVKWALVFYSNFTDLTRDQEYLISTRSRLSYIEGMFITGEGALDIWTFSKNSTQDSKSKLVSLIKENGLIYGIELARYYDVDQPPNTIDQEFKNLLDELHFIPDSKFDTDVTLSTFLERVPNVDNPTPGSVQSHPWLNLFIPKSRLFDFNENVLTMLPKLNETSGLFIFYPLNTNKWDDRMSVVIPDEDIIYTLGALHTSSPDDAGIYDRFNSRVLAYCEKVGINVKQYLPMYKTKEDWIKQFGSKWKTFEERKIQFDPKMILSPGQGIFNVF